MAVNGGSPGGNPWGGGYGGRRGVTVAGLG